MVRFGQLVQWAVLALARESVDRSSAQLVGFLINEQIQSAQPAAAYFSVNTNLRASGASKLSGATGTPGALPAKVSVPSSNR